MYIIYSLNEAEKKAHQCKYQVLTYCDSRAVLLYTPSFSPSHWDMCNLCAVVAAAAAATAISYLSFFLPFLCAVKIAVIHT